MTKGLWGFESCDLKGLGVSCFRGLQFKTCPGPHSIASAPADVRASILNV